jgi:hypothetical protein
MTNARPHEGTGVVLSVPGGHGQDSASHLQKSVRRLHAEIDKNTATLYGGRVGELLLQLGVPRIYNRSAKAWTVSVNRLDDVLAFAEFRQHRIVSVEVLR